MCKGVLPELLHLYIGSAPFINNIFVASALPSIAAWCKAVAPDKFDSIVI